MAKGKDTYGVGWSGEPRALRTYYVVKNGKELSTRYATLDEVFAEIDRQKGERDSFPGYPHLRRVAQTDRGRAELLEVSRTSDNFLIGLARFGEGDDAFVHSVFLGEAR
jgi:hypothetical protein